MEAFAEPPAPISDETNAARLQSELQHFMTLSFPRFLTIPSTLFDDGDCHVCPSSEALRISVDAAGVISITGVAVIGHSVAATVVQPVAIDARSCGEVAGWADAPTIVAALSNTALTTERIVRFRSIAKNTPFSLLFFPELMWIILERSALLILL
jgi:hypothetical protein